MKNSHDSPQKANFESLADLLHTMNLICPTSMIQNLPPLVMQCSPIKVDGKLVYEAHSGTLPVQWNIEAVAALKLGSTRLNPKARALFAASDRQMQLRNAGCLC